ncbi:hypothetical protein PGT21_021594 [Puccinia graminis f. sp. tritici]|uniref:Uncharacterized protein n=1 Tax=Puccinia graminis f. sp. tritici TaxID=56615 RepID=A0A5B0P1L8_PUCGR|nr:hypothetical protein PGTUg99_033174 [Puccinia graminis f. sp. tritici]KAA1099816.1 hypothetical protein PGT21_021594 [Puccinia graminis f. sp. tritici]
MDNYLFRASPDGTAETLMSKGRNPCGSDPIDHFASGSIPITHVECISNTNFLPAFSSNAARDEGGMPSFFKSPQPVLLTSKQQVSHSEEERRFVAEEMDPSSSSASDKGIKRESPDRLKIYSHSQSSTLAEPMDLERRPHKVIKLLGFSIVTPADPTSDLEGITTHSKQSGESSSPVKSESDIGEVKPLHSILRRKHKKISGSSQHIITPAACKIEPTQGSSEADATSTNDSIRKAIKKEYQSGVLKFDEKVFRPSPISGKINQNISKILKILSYDHNLNEIVLTEKQFIRYCMFLYHNQDTNSEGILMNDDERRKQKLELLDKLMENRQHWYRHWMKRATLNLENFPENLNVKMRNLIVMYLFYVEMISTIVPGSTEAGSELTKAFEFAQTIYGSRTSNHRIIDTEFYQKTLKIKKNVIRSISHTNLFPSLWNFLRLWMEAYRIDFLDLIIKNRLWDATKRFFNKIFVYSIENLNIQMQKHS